MCDESFTSVGRATTSTTRSSFGHLSLASRLTSLNIVCAGRVTSPKWIPLDTQIPFWLEKSLAARHYDKAENNSSRVSWKRLWHKPKSTLKFGKPLLHIGLHGVGPSKGEPRFSTSTGRESGMTFCHEARLTHPRSPTAPYQWLLLMNIQE